MLNIAQIVGAAEEKGIRLWTEAGELRYKAPKGVLTSEEIEQLRRLKPHIVAYLKSPATAKALTSESASIRGARRAPLTFSQLSHWRLFRLGERRSLRQIASATRLCGPLSRPALERSLALLAHRHEALRTRVIHSEDSVQQEILSPQAGELDVKDLTEQSRDLRELAVTQHIEQLILQPIDVATDPMVGIRLLCLAKDEHVLVVAMEHMISDAFSMGIFLRELFAAYIDVLSGREAALPPVRAQLAEYAMWQRRVLLPTLEQSAASWRERLRGYQPTAFPTYSSGEARAGWGTVPIHFDRELKGQFREWCRRKGTTLVMGVLTAYVATVLRWCQTSDLVIQYTTDGRDDPQIENTIGFFAFSLYLRITVQEQDNLADLLSRVVAEYCAAHERADCSYMDSQIPRPAFSGSTVFNWVPQGPRLELSARPQPTHALELSPVPFAHPMLKVLDRDSDPAVLFYDTDEGVTGALYFPLKRFPTQAMQSLAHSLHKLIRLMIDDETARLSGIALPGPPS